MTNQFTYVERLLKYCHDAITDVIPNRKTCLLEKLACQRHLDDLAKQEDPDYPYYFDEDAANSRCFFTECLQHVKGKWAGQFIKLEPHQIMMQSCVFGWLKKKDNLRRFYRIYFQAPRKQGKSMEVATSGLWMAFADGEKGAEVYSVAGSEKQAMMTFVPAWTMVSKNEDLREYYNLKLSGTPKNPTSIYNEIDMSLFCPVVGSPGDGSSPHCALIDEYHEAPTSVAYDAMITGGGARSQPLIYVTTTAGVNTSYPCYDLYLDCKKILTGSINDDRTFVLIYEPDENDDWQDFEVWKKVNVNYGVSIDQDYLWGRYQDAINKPNERNILLTKHLNIWQNAGVGAFDMLRWNKCADPTLKIEDFYGQECWLALDLASKIDLAALVYLFKYKRNIINTNCPKCYGEVVVKNGMNICVSGNKLEDGEVCNWEKPVSRNCVVGFADHYIPSETVEKKENQHYRTYKEGGWLNVTEGARTDFHLIEEHIKEADKNFIVKELVFDPAEASYLIQNIEQWCAFTCVEFAQGPANISQPMKEMEAMIQAEEFWHNSNPLYTWCVGNIVKKQARSGGSTKHYFPTKTNDKLKIDSGVATICGLGRLIPHKDEGAYEQRAASSQERILRVL
jgi:phage terminase large subunit-like protein